jgi:hypothetical protein
MLVHLAALGSPSQHTVMAWASKPGWSVCVYILPLARRLGSEMWSVSSLVKSDLNSL